MHLPRAKSMLSLLVNALLTVLLVVVTIAYFTLFERKLLAATQRRRGPSMVGFWGLLQAFADAMKLLFKSASAVSGSNYAIFVVSPVVLLSLSLAAWAFVPIGAPSPLLLEFNYSLAIVMILSGVNSYFIILSAISSHSRYSHIGGLRAIAQVLSYEVPLTIILLTICATGGGLNLLNFYYKGAPIGLLTVPAIIMLYIVLLAETNRTPFDLPEAEAELVAGYNLEYSSILFAFFFLAEYNNIIVGSMVMSILFFNKITFVGCLGFLALFIITRAVVPRYTYAQLMSMCWTALIPISTLYFLFSLVIMSTSGLLPIKTYCALGALMPAPKTVAVVFDYTTNSPMQTAVIFFIATLTFVALLLLINKIALKILQNNKSASSYECGFAPFSSPVCNFEPNYIPVALMFLIYDVDILLIFPWAMSVANQSAGGLAALLAFIGLMLCGLIVEAEEEGVFNSF